MVLDNNLEREEIDLIPSDETELSESKYVWDEEFQREIVCLLLTDRSFLIEGLSLIKSNYFTNQIHTKICNLVYEYFNNYNAIPSKVQLTQMIRDSYSEKSEDIVAGHISELETIYNYYSPGIETREYYRDRVTNFAKTQSLKIAFSKCLDEIKKDPESEKTWATVQDILKNSLLVDKSFDFGLDYFLDFESRYDRRNEDNENNEKFTSGFEAIDNALKNGGLLRGEMGSWVGLSGTGKSLCLVHAAINNLNLGKKVLYISLEIDQDAVAERFDAQIADPLNEYDLKTNNLIAKKEIVFEGIKNYISDYDDKQRLVIRQFPGGSMGVSEFRSYLSQVNVRGFKPDLVIIDYLGEMKDYPGMPRHESRYEITRDLRGIAVQEKICILTAMQPNRGAKEVIRIGEVIDDEQLSDSYAQIKPLDAMWSINQTTEEKESSLARVFVVKHREGKSRFIFNMGFDYDKLKLFQVSKDKYEKTMRDYRANKQISASEKALEEDSFDKIINSNKTSKRLEEFTSSFSEE